ncbi:hypothetical protein RB595_007813 [Gaeumannomyces hyphopodioides]
MPNAHLANVSAEIRSLILADLPKEALLACRLVCRILSAHATPLAFRHVLLSARHATSAHSFVRISETEHLRRLVQEVTCDTYVGDWCRYRGGKGYKTPAAFLAALPCLRHLRGLRTLNIFFSKYTARRNFGMRFPTTLAVAETADFRFRVLHTVFQALRGTWARKMWIALALDLHLQGDGIDPVSYDGDGAGEGPIDLESLAISNLSDFPDRRLTRTRAFHEVLAAPSFKSLKLLFTHWEKEIEPELRLELPDLYKAYESLPLTWLKPTVARNLATLSLYDRHYFGWCPKLDLRLAGSLPNLRVLALGNYVFSHNWQVDWVAGLGSLQELYLDDCPILWRAIVRPPLDDENYPTADAFSADPNNDRIELGLPLRWHVVLARWRDALAGHLRVFSMGSGDWDGKAQPDEQYNDDLAGRRVFLTYDRPPLPPPLPKSLSARGTPDPFISARYDGGVGLRRARQNVLQYVQFNVDRWVERDAGVLLLDDDEIGIQFGVHTRALDEAALEDMHMSLTKVEVVDI